MTIEEIEKAIKFYGHCRYMFCYSFIKSYPSKHKWIQDKWEKNSDDTLNYLKEAIIEYGRKCAAEGYELGKEDALHPLTIKNM